MLLSFLDFFQHAMMSTNPLYTTPLNTRAYKPQRPQFKANDQRIITRPSALLWHSDPNTKLSITITSRLNQTIIHHHHSYGPNNTAQPGEQNRGGNAHATFTLGPEYAAQWPSRGARDIAAVAAVLSTRAQQQQQRQQQRGEQGASRRERRANDGSSGFPGTC